MESFYRLFPECDVDVVNFSKGSRRIDLLSRLPLEIAIVVLRLLDPKSLLAAALVCWKWANLCRLDPVLRCRVRRQLRREKRERMDPSSSQRLVLRELQTEYRPFAPRNNQLVVQCPSDQGHPMYPSRFWMRREALAQLQKPYQTRPPRRLQHKSIAAESVCRAGPGAHLRL